MLLAIDTAGPNCAVALSDRTGRDVRILGRVQDEIGRGHAECLIPMIETLLKTASADFTAIDRIAVTTGPGSFTGVRIGLATARGLALSMICDVVGIGVLDALIWPYSRDRNGLIVASLDARRGEVFSAMRSERSDIDTNPVLTTIEALARQIASLDPVTDSTVFLVGSASKSLRDELNRHNIQSIVENEAAFADIDVISRMGWEMKAGKPPEPVYLRQLDAKPQNSAVPLAPEID